MSGAEAVVGLVLGILPLLISTAEHYDTILRPFKRYKNYAPELGLFQKQLRTQKTIFRNECMLLLTQLTDNQTAKVMLKETNHPSWTDSGLEENFGKQLGDSGNACKALIEQIEETLKAIEEDADGFGLAIQKEIPLGSIGGKSSRSGVKKKLKFSVAEPRLKQHIKNLRKHNQDLTILARQTAELGHQTHGSTSLDLALRQDKMFEERRIVHDASSRLYKALERACQFHTQHLAILRLDPQQVDGQDTKSTVVRFNMGFTRHPGIASAIFEPVWIGVESILGESTIKSENPTPQYGNQRQQDDESRCRKHAPSGPSKVGKRIKTDSVRFSLPISCGDTSSNSSILESNSLDNTALPDFCIQHDFCRELRKCGRQKFKSKYIGYFEKAGPCKHLIYFSPPVSTCGSDTVSLAEVLSKMAQGSASEQFLQYMILRLARQLASAVLNFHATPMLKNSWRSDDVVFFGKHPSSASIALPHLQVHVGDSFSTSNNLITEQNKTEKRDVFIRNPYLFNLGVVLIELAHQTPIGSLRQDCDIMNSKGSKQADFSAAIRLSETMATSLGPAYAKIVRKCLWCDFGEGVTDLGDRSLQASVYTGVVCELERLERDFAKLQLSD